MIELGQLEAHHDEFAKRHTRVVAVSVDGLDDSKKTQQDFPHLTVVADHDHRLVDAAAVLHPGAAPGQVPRPGLAAAQAADFIDSGSFLGLPTVPRPGTERRCLLSPDTRRWGS